MKTRSKRFSAALAAAAGLGVLSLTLGGTADGTRTASALTPGPVPQDIAPLYTYDELEACRADVRVLLERLGEVATIVNDERSTTMTGLAVAQVDMLDADDLAAFLSLGGAFSRLLIEVEHLHEVALVEQMDRRAGGASGGGMDAGVR